MISLTKYNYKASINQSTFEFYYYIKYNNRTTHNLIIDMINSNNNYNYKFFFILFLLENKLKYNKKHNKYYHIKNEQLNRLVKFLLKPENKNYI